MLHLGQRGGHDGALWRGVPRSPRRRGAVCNWVRLCVLSPRLPVFDFEASDAGRGGAGRRGNEVKRRAHVLRLRHCVPTPSAGTRPALPCRCRNGCGILWKICSFQRDQSQPGNVKTSANGSGVTTPSLLQAYEHPFQSDRTGCEHEYGWRRARSGAAPAAAQPQPKKLPPATASERRARITGVVPDAGRGGAKAGLRKEGNRPLPCTPRHGRRPRGGLCLRR